MTALRHAGMSGHDIAALLAERALQATPQRPLLIPNEEIATYGLNRRPDVLAGEWTEGNDVFTCCRACIEQKPQPYQAQIDGASAAIYDGHGLCDICGRDIAQAVKRTPDDREGSRDR